MKLSRRQWFTKAGLLIPACGIIRPTLAQTVLINSYRYASGGGGGSTVSEDTVGTPVSTAANVQSITTLSCIVGSGANRLLVVSAGVGDDTTADRPVASVTSNQGGTFIKYDAIDEGVFVSMEIWYMIAPATATHTITVTWTGTNCLQLCAQATSYTGVNQSTPFGTVAKASGSTGTSVSTGSITYSTGGIIYGTAVSDSEGTLEGPGGIEKWQVLNVGSDTAYAGATRTTTGAITFTQANNERYAVLGGLIQPAP